MYRILQGEFQDVFRNPEITGSDAVVKYFRHCEERQRRGNLVQKRD